MMGANRIIVRETAISIAINVAISAGMFVALFGLAASAPLNGVRGYAADFVPQAFMVSLMGGLVPGLMMAAKAKSHARLSFVGVRGGAAIAVRALAVALALAVLAGGGIAALLLLLSAAPFLAPLPALALKMLFGALVALAATPGAVRFALADARNDTPTVTNESPYGHTY